MNFPPRRLLSPYSPPSQTLDVLRKLSGVAHRVTSLLHFVSLFDFSSLETHLPVARGACLAFPISIDRSTPSTADSVLRRLEPGRASTFRPLLVVGALEGFATGQVLWIPHAHGRPVYSFQHAR